jgi:divalent metal cation (Fe/Co/Zn/Cd) transporter
MPAPPRSALRRRLMQPRTLLRLSIVVALVTIVLKGLAGYVTNSMGLISDAMESFVNLASATFALGMVTIATRPPDDDHPYGHHKAEYFSSGFEGILILGASAAIAGGPGLGTGAVDRQFRLQCRPGLDAVPGRA